MEDKRIEEIKDAMYRIACSTSAYDYRVEAAKAYAMLCMAQQDKQSEVVTTVDSKKTGWAIEIQEG